MSIPFYKPRKIDDGDFFAKTKRILDTRWFTNSGENVAALEKEIADIHHVKHCIAVSNGTIGIQLVLKGLNLTGEVITTPFTFIATAHAILWQGLKAVFADIDSRTLTISPGKLEEKITSKTSAILGVHVFGQFCDVERIEKIARKRNIKVVFDAAHNFMASYKGTPVGNFGDAEVLSFHATKIFHTFEGGAILTNDSELAGRLRLLKNFGFKGIDVVDYLGINAKLNEVSAAYGLSLLPFLPETIERLNQIQAKYRLLLRDIPGLSFFELSPEVKGNGQYTVSLIDEKKFGLSRDQLWAHLWSNGIQTRRYFYPGLHRCEPYRLEYSGHEDPFPETDRISDIVLCLPCYYDLADEDIEGICERIRQSRDQRVRIRDWYEELLRSSEVPSHMKQVVESIKRHTLRA
jgi:dTDP-4-amino-4,6-dideoxygalactose transaminase